MTTVKPWSIEILSIGLLSLLLAGCTGIVVDSSDSTPPSIIVTLSNARALDAQYSDRDRDGNVETIRAEIDPARDFEVTATTDRRRIQVLFTGVDMESSIFDLRASLQISYRCRPTGEPLLSRPVTTTISEISSTRAADGERVPDRRTVLVEFTAEELWTRGTCSTFGDYINLDRGRLSDIEVRYEATTTNNSVPIGPDSRAVVSGRFTVADQQIDLNS